MAMQESPPKTQKARWAFIYIATTSVMSRNKYNFPLIIPGVQAKQIVVKPLESTSEPPSTLVAATAMSTTIELSLLAPRSNATRCMS